MNTLFRSSRHAPVRTGNTLVVALGVLSVVAAVIAVSSVGATTTLRETKDSGDRLQALAAVEAVLARHERSLLDLADSGALADFGTRTPTRAVDNNYGVDVVGNCSVRWKIEPCRTQDKAGTLDYIVNPAPTGVADTGSGHRQANGVNFMFRISAEASVRPAADQPPTAIAQGARYAIAINEPLFRYVIFYAQSGPNGDLEFSHDPNVTIQGDVHSNGAIYIGSGTWVNHWGAAAGGSGFTKLGPDSELNPIRVTGVDGIFCLSKPLMFGALNGFTMGGIAPSWYGNWDWSNVYTPNGAPSPVRGATLVINPNGVRDAAKFNTNPVGSSGSVRQINGIDVYSGDSGGTDSRDGFRTNANEKWNPNSLTWYANKVRTLATNGRKKPLSLGTDVDANSRPFDPIQLSKVASAADPNTDAPELSTPSLTGANEKPGYYFAQAIGGQASRLANGTGWSVTPTVPAPVVVGLAIRERPIPDTNLWPGSTAAGAQNVLPPMSSLNPNFMPFAYGKHWYPTPMPFSPTWVTEGTGSTDDNNLAVPNSNFGLNRNEGWYAGIAKSSASATYLGKGRLLISSACRPGGTAFPGGDDQKFYNNNWQFIHLGKPQKSPVAGVTNKFFVENTGWAGSNFPGQSRHRLQGLPTLSVASANFSWPTPAITPVIAPATQNFSMRCSAFLVPNTSDLYTFGANVTTGARIWVDGRVVYEKWGLSGAVSTPIPLIANVSYPIVVEMENDGPGALLDVQWTRSLLASYPALASIPAANLFKGTSSAFKKANWTSLVARLDPSVLNGPTTMKAGIMVRPGDGGLSPLLSGRDAFLMLGYSPTRGIFTERRMQPSMVKRVTANAWYVGAGAKLNGVVQPAVIWAPAAYTGTFTQNGVTAYQTVERASTVTASYTVSAPYTVYEGPYVSVTEDPEEAKSGQATLDGRSVNVTYGFAGNGIWSKSATYYKRTIRRIDQTVRFTNSNGTANFTPYSNCTVQLFGPTSNTTTTTWVNPGLVTPVSGVPGSFMATMRTYSNYTPYDSRTTDAPTVANGARKEFQDNWVYSEDHPTMSLTQVVARLNALQWNGRTDWMVAPVDMTPPSILPPDPSFDFPAAPLPPAIVANPYPGTYTFAVSASALKPDISVNSLVTSKGFWLTPAVPKNVPWSTAWTAASLLHPSTGSHAPDMWVNLPAPAPPVSALSLQNFTAGSRYTDDQPAILPSAANSKEIWLMLTRNPANNLVSFWYYLGATRPSGPGSYSKVLDANNNQLTADISGWGTDLLMGPCLQSGFTTAQATAFFTDLEVGSSDPGNVAGKFDFQTWDKMVPDGRNPMSAYLASQYQVFWGSTDITEDFFSYGEDIPNGRTATEEGYVNPREFWSQSRWWEDGAEKDTDASGNYLPLNANNRQLWARSTFLTLNLQQVQAYISTTTLPQARNLPITQGTARPASSLVDPVLKNTFNGLIYAARTNRYQWNPSPAPAPATNPFSYNSAAPLPNGAANTGAGTMLTATTMSAPSMFHGGFHKLQPYTVGTGMDISEAPPFKPQHFHHGVRLINGSAITWGVSTGSTFGSGGTTIVTPNQLFIQGDLNTQTTNVVVTGSPGLQAKNTPLSVVGDQITYLSNSFGASAADQMDVSRLQGFVPYVPTATAQNYLPPVLLNPTSVSAATSTTYVAAMITNNQPTTCARVKEGQGAPFIDTMQYLEKWGPGVRMDYKGSLVVIDSRRYTDAFLLDGPRTNGRSPFGIMGWNATWDSVPAANRWTGTVPAVYNSPDRTLSYNRDLLTDQGTPPFTPKGVSSTGLGGWVRIVK